MMKKKKTKLPWRSPTKADLQRTIDEMRLEIRDLKIELAVAKAEPIRERLDVAAFKARELEIAEIRGDRAAIRGELLRIRRHGMRSLERRAYEAWCMAVYGGLGV